MKNLVTLRNVLFEHMVIQNISYGRFKALMMKEMLYIF